MQAVKLCGGESKIEGTIMFYIIVILAAIFTIPAKADETLKFRAVQHATSVQTMKVDANGHTMGLVRTVGMVFFT